MAASDLVSGERSEKPGGFFSESCQLTLRHSQLLVDAWFCRKMYQTSCLMSMVTKSSDFGPLVRFLKLLGFFSSWVLLGNFLSCGNNFLAENIYLGTLFCQKLGALSLKVLSDDVNLCDLFHNILW